MSQGLGLGNGLGLRAKSQAGRYYGRVRVRVRVSVRIRVRVRLRLRLRFTLTVTLTLTRPTCAICPPSRVAWTDSPTTSRACAGGSSPCSSSRWSEPHCATLSFWLGLHGRREERDRRRRRLWSGPEWLNEWSGAVLCAGASRRIYTRVRCAHGTDHLVNFPPFFSLRRNRPL